MAGFIRLFSGLDRLAPGNAESLRWAIGVAGTATDGVVLDAGCGTGGDLGALLGAVPAGRVVAVDTHSRFIDRVRVRFPRVEAQQADMMDPPGGPFDLIWSAGAVYSVGVENALSGWRSQLKPGGCVAFSDLRWRNDHRPDEVRAFFEETEGVQLGNTAQLDAEIVSAGYRLLDARWLGAPGWASYYGPLEVALDGFDADPDLTERLRAEIALWRTHGVSYGYRLVVCTPDTDIKK